MAVLTEIVRNVLVIVLVAGFLEMLLPEGNMKPLVRLCIGMFILIAVLNPVLSFFFDKRDFQIGSWDYQPEADQVIDIEKEGARINQSLVGQSKNIARIKLEEQIDAVAVLVPGVQSVKSQVEVDDKGAVQTLILSVEPETEEVEAGESKVSRSQGNSGIDNQSEERLKAKISNLMHNLYGLEESSIKIVFEGG
ncbi:MAG: stage III sporulation protein AF [Deltaproteobacteria bacterium]